jgi:hypothetical protein
MVRYLSLSLKDFRKSNRVCMVIVYLCKNRHSLIVYKMDRNVIDNKSNDKLLIETLIRDIISFICPDLYYETRRIWPTSVSNNNNLILYIFTITHLVAPYMPPSHQPPKLPPLSYFFRF